MKILCYLALVITTSSVADGHGGLRRLENVTIPDMNLTMGENETVAPTPEESTIIGDIEVDESGESSRFEVQHTGVSTRKERECLILGRVTSTCLR